MSALAFISVVGINLIFSGAYIFGKIGVSHFPPFLFGTLRFLIVFIVLLPFLRITKEISGHWKLILLFCLLMGPGVYSLMYWALYLSNNASVILIATQFATPISVLLGVFILKESVSVGSWLGILLALTGVMVVGIDSAVLGYPMAFILVLISACFYAGANVVNRLLKNSKISLLNLNAIMSFVGFIVLAFLTIITDEPWQQSILTQNTDAWIAVIYSSIVVSVFGHIGLFKLLRYYSVTTIMPFYVLTPIFGVMGAIIFLNEEPTLRFFIGSVIAISGVAIVNYLQSKQ